ncbi:GGDEF domain-containing protein [Paraburkholderia phenoliruptrix]|uniref:GGDEF domain-containing protein n=1 Tax=Paraburkholderia phenoliruptrix TaxID=252970 RepID=UPI002869CD9C|nr:GGDEF domain-containing protein [Paraburkholderia phenoliruptrix]WMY10966.1 GGDEF domain-containing protein [Paraburkholderia phenoliruptrix]
MSSTGVLLLIAMAACMASAAVLGSLARHRIAGLGRWLAAHCFLIVAFGALVSSRGDYSPAIVLIACFCVLLAAVLILQGCRQFASRPMMGRYEFLGLIALAGAVLYWTVIVPDENLRAAVMSCALCYTRMAVGWTIWNSRGQHRRRYGHWLVLVAASVGATLYAARMVQCVFFANPAAKVLEPTPLNLAFVSAGILSLLLLSIGLVMLVNDSLVENAQRLATIDELTGLLARREILSRGEEMLKAARSTGSPLSVAIIDIDDFKLINDRYGHPVGDRVLKKFAVEVSQRLRQRDLFGRLGGEEFAVLSPETGKARAATFVESILSSVSGGVTTREGEARCNFSAGIEESGANDTLNDVICRADAALYRAKREGKRRVELAAASLT